MRSQLGEADIQRLWSRRKRAFSSGLLLTAPMPASSGCSQLAVHSAVGVQRGWRAPREGSWNGRCGLVLSATLVPRGVFQSVAGLRAMAGDWLDD